MNARPRVIGAGLMMASILGATLFSGTAQAMEPARTMAQPVSYSTDASTQLSPARIFEYQLGLKSGFRDGHAAGLQDAKKDCKRSNRKNQNRSFNFGDYERGYAEGFDRGYNSGYDHNEDKYCHHRKGNWDH